MARWHGSENERVIGGRVARALVSVGLALVAFGLFVVFVFRAQTLVQAMTVGGLFLLVVGLWYLVAMGPDAVR